MLLRIFHQNILKLVPAILLCHIYLSALNVDYDLSYYADTRLFQTIIRYNHIADDNFQGKLTITNSKEIEIEGGKATDIVVIATEEAEFENITISGTIDLTKMAEGEVEIEGIAKDIVKYNAENKDVEVEFED